MHRTRAHREPSAILLVCAALLLGGCGAAAGGKCDPGRYACLDAATALECRSRIWTELPCSGPAGCAVESGSVTCDQTTNQPGDLCPLNQEGQATCKTPELNALLECRNGILVVAQSCSSCSRSGNQIVCQP